jgi:hypothetical protein
VLDGWREIRRHAMVPPTPDQFAAMEQWLGEVRGVLIALSDFIPSDALSIPSRLIDHGEAPEALVQMAWVITNYEVRVPSWIIDAIYELGGQINDPEHLPPNLRDFAADA